MTPLVIFDMDGTLVETFGLIRISYEYAMGEYMTAKPSDQEIGAISGYSLSHLLAQHVPSHYLGTAVERFHSCFGENFKVAAGIYPEIKDLLVNLQNRGFHLAVCTSASRVWTDIALENSGITGLFSAVMTSDDVAHKKPNPEGVEVIMKKVNSCSEATTFVGDEPNDIKASKEANVKSAAALWGSRKKGELIALNPDLVLNTPSDLLLLLEKLD